MTDLAPKSLSADNLRPNLTAVLTATGAIAIISILTLPWQAAIASTVLGLLMITGADVDARTFLLPDTVTWGTVASGLLAALVLDASDPVAKFEGALGRAVLTAFVVALLRWSYAHLRQREGLGMGDVKLSAGVGAWLPLEVIPLCFSLAAIGALVTVLLVTLRGHDIDRTTKIPFGAYLCPALWLVYYMVFFYDL